MYQPNYDARVSPPKPPTLDITQPQIYRLDNILPPGPITEPTQQQIQQVVGTQFLPLKKPVLDFVKPWVDYGLNEAKHTSQKHALTEVAAIMFLVGKGFNPTIAHYIVNLGRRMSSFSFMLYKDSATNVCCTNICGTFIFHVISFLK